MFAAIASKSPKSPFIQASSLPIPAAQPIRYSPTQNLRQVCPVLGRFRHPNCSHRGSTMPAQLENPVQKLTLDQQKALAEVELAKFHRKERMHQLARGYPGRRWLSLAFFLLGL